MLGPQNRGSHSRVSSFSFLLLPQVLKFYTTTELFFLTFVDERRKEVAQKNSLFLMHSNIEFYNKTNSPLYSLHHVRSTYLFFNLHLPSAVALNKNSCYCFFSETGMARQGETRIRSNASPRLPLTALAYMPHNNNDPSNNGPLSREWLVAGRTWGRGEDYALLQALKEYHLKNH